MEIPLRERKTTHEVGSPFADCLYGPCTPHFMTPLNCKQGRLTKVKANCYNFDEYSKIKASLEARLTCHKQSPMWCIGNNFQNRFPNLSCHNNELIRPIHWFLLFVILLNDKR